MNPSKVMKNNFHKIYATAAMACLIFMVGCTQNEDFVEQTHPNGNAKTIVTYNIANDTKQKKHIKQFYEDQTLEFEGDYDNEGKRHGQWIYNYPNGKLWSKAQYKNGQRHGESAVYYNNGQLRYQGNYKNDKQTGIWLFFDEKGNKVKEVDY